MTTINPTTQLSPEGLKEVQRILQKYPEGKHKSALLPVLHIAQQECNGYLSAATMDYVAQLIGITPIEVYEVATFYSMYNTQPVGEVLIEVCRTGPCVLRGVEDTIEYLENKLQIKVGQTTADNKFTIKGVECLGACGYAPMFQVGNDYYENLTPAKIDELLENFAKNPPARR